MVIGLIEAGMGKPERFNGLLQVGAEHSEAQQ
jgi:hypothetical protein